MMKIIVIVLLLCYSVENYQFFYSTPEISINLGGITANTFIIADDQSMIVVGYNNGMLQSFTIEGVLLTTYAGFSNKITKINWMQGVGFLAMDNQGNVKLYQSSNINPVAGIQVSTTNLDGSTYVTSLNGYFYIGFTYTFSSGQFIQSNVNEYVFNSANNSFVQNRVYYVPNFTYPGFFFYNSAQYSLGYQTLMVQDVNGEQLHVFNCSTGALMNTYKIPNYYPGSGNSPVNSPIQMYGVNNTFILIENSPNLQGVMTSNLYTFSGGSYNFQFVSSLALGTAWTVCQSNLYFAHASSSGQVINIYSNFENFLQQLSGSNGNSLLVKCSQSYFLSLGSTNYLSLFQYVPTPSSNSMKFTFGKVQIITIGIIAGSLFLGIVAMIFYKVCKQRKQQFLLDKSTDKQATTKAKKFITRLSYLSTKLWELSYLIIFTLANVLDLVWSSQIGQIMYAFIPLVLVAFALLIKLIMLFGKVSIKDFFNMQLQFISPYVLTVINVILVIRIGVSFNYNPQSIQYFQDFKPDLPRYFLYQGIQYLLVTAICSLVMNQKSISKTQFYFILLNIILQAAGSLYMTIYYIQKINQSSDEMKDAINQAMQSLFNGSLSTDQYDSIYKALTQNISAFQTAKDYALASLASIIAVLIILIDMIGRPFEKKEQQEQLLQEFNKKFQKTSKNEQGSATKIQNQGLKKRETEMSPVLKNDYKELEINVSDRQSERE